MNAFQHALTSTSLEVCSTPTGGANPFLRRSGWTSSTADKERSAKRLSLVENSGVGFKRQKTPSSCLTTNNEHSSTSGRRSLATESDRDEGEGMNVNDIVHQRNVAGIQDDSPSVSEVKVRIPMLFLILNEN